VAEAGLSSGAADPFARCEAYWRAARAPAPALASDAGEAGAGAAAAAAADTAEELQVALPQGVLSSNAGLPLLVVGTKADVLAKASDDVETSLRLEFLQRALRRFCLAHGASLTYASARVDTNTALLYAYVLHRLYPASLPLADAARAVAAQTAPISADLLSSARAAVHVPAGLDMPELVDVLAKSQAGGARAWSADSPFQAVFPAPSGAAGAGTAGTGADPADEQEEAATYPAFVAKLLAKQKLLPEPVRAPSVDAAAAALKSFNASASQLKLGAAEAPPAAPTNPLAAALAAASAGAGQPGAPAAAGAAGGSGASSGAAGAAAASTAAAPGAVRAGLTGQDGKEMNPALIANFFQNLLNRDKQ
jgi:hypothetical protein